MNAGSPLTEADFADGLALHCAGKIPFQVRNVSPSPSGFWVKKSGTTVALFVCRAVLAFS